jgi:branched-chain amino acid transport system ATP-binding protein
VADQLLEVSGLVKNYGSLRALAGVSLQVSPREVRGLIGPNGSGKSTLLHCIAGMLEPDAGDIRLGGNRLNKLPLSERTRLGLSIKFQHTRIFGELTVYENVLLALQQPSRYLDLLLSRSKNALASGVTALLERVGLRDQATMIAGALSHGEQQWLEIAMALSIEPKMLLLDEPTAGMNARERAVTGALIAQLRDTGCGILIVEHDIEFIARISDRISVLEEGAVIVEGAPDEIRRDHRVQAVFLGHN